MPNNNPQHTTPQQQISRAAEGATRAAERLSEGAEQATSVAIEKVRQVRDEAQSGLEQQRAQVADRIRRLSGVLRSGSQTLSTDDPLAQQLFDSAGASVERVADYIANITPSELAGDVQSLARRSPGLFFGGSFLIGLALGRFAKSSAASVASSRGGEYEDEEEAFELRPAKRRKASKQSASASSAGRPWSGPASDAASTTTGESSAPTSTQSGTLPSGVSSSASKATGTVGSGSEQGVSSNTSPSYGASTTKAPQPQPHTSSPKSHTIDPGEGNK